MGGSMGQQSGNGNGPQPNWNTQHMNAPGFQQQGVPNQFGQPPPNVSKSWMSTDFSQWLPTLQSMMPQNLEATLRTAFQSLSPEQEVNIEGKLLAALEREKIAAVAREDYSQAEHYKEEIDFLLTKAYRQQGQSRTEGFVRAASFMATASKGKGKGKGFDRDRGEGKGCDNGKGKGKGKAFDQDENCGFDIDGRDDFAKGHGGGKGFGDDFCRGKGKSKGFEDDLGKGKGFVDDDIRGKGKGKGFEDDFGKGCGKGLDDGFLKGKGKGFVDDDSFFDSRAKGQGKCGVSPSFARRERAMNVAADPNYCSSFFTDGALAGSFSSQHHNGSFMNGGFRDRSSFCMDRLPPDSSFAQGLPRSAAGTGQPQLPVGVSFATTGMPHNVNSRMPSQSSFMTQPGGCTTQPPMGYSTGRPQGGSVNMHMPSTNSFGPVQQMSPMNAGARSKPGLEMIAERR